MISRITASFRATFARLPTPTQHQARRAYRLFRSDPYHPSLQFKAVSPTTYSVRIGLHYRALGTRNDANEIVWFWIGSHADYDTLLKRI